MKKNENMKIMLLQKRITVLEKQLNKLTKENERLKAEKLNQTHFPQEEYQKVINELKQIKNEYNNKLCEISNLRKKYETDMNDLIISIESGVMGIHK